jgi:catechol 2,3-dioxygenase-like lactoylglutathione lyase family enzyme
MSRLLGIDHVAITVADLEASCAFYDRLFGAQTIGEHLADGRVGVRIIVIGGHARLSVHQAGNGLDLVAVKPTVGSADVCFRWAGTIDEAAEHLATYGVEIIGGPYRRQTVDGLPSKSVYFRDPDGNLTELMAASTTSAAGCSTTW